MPMISQLPVAIELAASDAVPVSQSGIARAVSVGSLLAGTQPAIRASSGTLLGRRSLGAGGPEEIAVGAGLTLNQGTLDIGDGLFEALETIESISSEGRLLAVEDGRLKAVSSKVEHGLYTAGKHIEIDPSGVISAIWPDGTSSSNLSSWPLSVENAINLLTVASDDALPVVHKGTLGTVTYEKLLNGRTIDQLQQAAAVSDGDQILVSQGDAIMVRQNFSAVWHWLSEKTPSVRMPVVELSTDTTLDPTVHNGRLLVCTAEVTITPVVLNAGSGFHCEIVNLSSGDVLLASPIVTASGGRTVPAGAAAMVRSMSCSLGTIVYASGFGAIAGTAAPGKVMNLRQTEISISAVSVGWDIPGASEAVSGYTLQTRQVGTAAWTIRGDGITVTSYTIIGLVPGLSYEVAVAANNAGGRGALSSILNVAIPVGLLAPGIVTGLSASPQSSSSVSVSWSAPASGGTPATYTVQYRVSGSGIWGYSIPNVSATTLVVNDLVPGTAFEFRVYALNDGGAGPPTASAVAMTFPQAGAVASIAWNLAPVGSYSSGVGSIGVNARVQPADASIRFGFSTSSVVAPDVWVSGIHVNTDFWAAYVSTPGSSGTWYAWAQGLDGSATMIHPIPFTVT